MAGVYLGESGRVELMRHGRNAPLTGALHPTNVNVGRRRFSFAFDPSSLISGDLITITRLGGGNLELVDNHPYPDGRWYCHVDDAGGVRLYDDFRSAINGDIADAKHLVEPTALQQVSVLAVGRQHRGLAGITEWTLTTNREAADLTTLGEEHRRFYNDGLMSGQGSLRCFWNYEQSLCDDGAARQDNAELPHYMAQLVLRCQLGAEFMGAFYIKAGDVTPVNATPNIGSHEDFIWWEAKCLVTNVGMTFTPGQPIATAIEFITTGPIHLKMGTPPECLLKEDGSLLLQEDGTRILLESD